MPPVRFIHSLLTLVLIGAVSSTVPGCRKEARSPSEAEIERGEGLVEQEQVYTPPEPEETGPEESAPESAPGSDEESEDDDVAYPIETLETRYTKDIQGDGPLYAVLETSEGDIRCRLFEKEVPRTVDNFVGLARGLKPWRDPETGKTVTRPLYDGLIFHRVVPDLLIQTGDPTNSGMGDPGFFILDEFDEDLQHDEPGTLSMAQSRPDGNGSQFFITVGKAPQFDGRYPVFGRCENIDVIEAISHADVGDSRVQRPVDPITLQRVRFERR